MHAQIPAAKKRDMYPCRARRRHLPRAGQRPNEFSGALAELAEMRVEVITPIRASDAEESDDASVENGSTTA